MNEDRNYERIGVNYPKDGSFWPLGEHFRHKETGELYFSRWKYMRGNKTIYICCNGENKGLHISEDLLEKVDEKNN